MRRGLVILLTVFKAVWASNWLVLVNSSPSWYDYRHSSDVLLMYQAAKTFGVKDSNIILMNAGNSPCDARNPLPGRQYADDYRDVYAGVQVDYRGQQVNPNEVLAILTGRVDSDIPLHKQLKSDSLSNIFLFFAGHGTRNGMLKFGDTAGISAGELAAAIEEMHIGRRYQNLLVIAETCHAEAFLAKIRSPNVVTLASSAWDRDSYAIGRRDTTTGLPLADEFSACTAARLEHIPMSRHQLNKTLGEFVNEYELDALRSSPIARFDLHPRGSELQVVSFLADVADRGASTLTSWH